MAFLMLAAFGPLVPAYFGIMAFRLLFRRDNLRIIDFFPAAVLTAYCLVILVFPASNAADSTEFRTGPLCLFTRFSRYGSGRGWQLFCGIRSTAPDSVSGIDRVGIGPLDAGGAVDARSRHSVRAPSLGATATLTRNPLGLATSADFIRRNAKPGDVVLSSNLDPWSINAALSERPAFVSLSESLKLSDHSKLLADRTNVFWAIRTASDFGEISRIADQNGIGWYLLRQGEEGSWTGPILSRAVFSQNGYFVFRFDRSGKPG